MSSTCTLISHKSKVLKDLGYNLEITHHTQLDEIIQRGRYHKRYSKQLEVIVALNTMVERARKQRDMLVHFLLGQWIPARVPEISVTMKSLFHPGHEMTVIFVKDQPKKKLLGQKRLNATADDGEKSVLNGMEHVHDANSNSGDGDDAQEGAKRTAINIGKQEPWYKRDYTVLIFLPSSGIPVLPDFRSEELGSPKIFG
ncbi:MAG: hypothetical protein L6R41_003119 [Letrouitia leprolyta]|nr:MAG: hypothetical protein L6R41_003119 [Letrouitia leprolyta]